MTPSTRLQKKYNLFVLEDAAQAFGADYHNQKAGALADVAATSFYPAKPLGCYGDGGAVFTNDTEMYETLVSLRVHGQATSGDKYDNVRIGLNARMDTIQAAILLEKLKLFDQEIELRNQVANSYTEKLNGVVTTPTVPDGQGCVWAQYSVQSDNREKIREALAAESVPTAVFYPIPVHLSTAYKHLGYKAGDFPVSESAAKRIFSLPMHPYLEGSRHKTNYRHNRSQRFDMNSGTIRGIRSSLIFALDLIVILAIFSGIYYLRLDKLPNYLSPDLWLITATFVATLFVSGTYFRERSTDLPSLPIRTFLVCCVGGIICVVWLYLLGPSKFTEYFGRGILTAATILCGIATTGIRFFINRLYHRQESGTELLYLGSSTSGAAFLNELNNHSEVRSVTVAANQKMQCDFKKVAYATAEIGAVLNNTKWQSIIIDPSHDSDADETEKLIGLRLKGIPILSLSDFYEKFWYMIPVHDISDDWFLRSQGFSMLGNPIRARMKRGIGYSTICLCTIGIGSYCCAEWSDH